MVAGVGGRGGAGRYVELGEDVGEMTGDRLVAEHQLLRDLGVAVAGSNQAEDLELAPGETAGRLAVQQFLDLLPGRDRAELAEGPGRRRSARRSRSPRRRAAGTTVRPAPSSARPRTAPAAHSTAAVATRACGSASIRIATLQRHQRPGSTPPTRAIPAHPKPAAIAANSAATAAASSTVPPASSTSTAPASSRDRCTAPPVSASNRRTGGDGRGRATAGEQQQGSTRLRLVPEPGRLVIGRLGRRELATDPQDVAALTQREPGGGLRTRRRIATARVVELRQRLAVRTVQPQDLTPMYGALPGERDQVRLACRTSGSAQPSTPTRGRSPAPPGSPRSSRSTRCPRRSATAHRPRPRPSPRRAGPVPPAPGRSTSAAGPGRPAPARAGRDRRTGAPPRSSRSLDPQRPGEVALVQAPEEVVDPEIARAPPRPRAGPPATVRRGPPSRCRWPPHPGVEHQREPEREPDRAQDVAVVDLLPVAALQRADAGVVVTDQVGRGGEGFQIAGAEARRSTTAGRRRSPSRAVRTPPGPAPDRRRSPSDAPLREHARCAQAAARLRSAPDRAAMRLATYAASRPTPGSVIEAKAYWKRQTAEEQAGRRPRRPRAARAASRPRRSPGP